MIGAAGQWRFQYSEENDTRLIIIGASNRKVISDTKTKLILLTGY